MSVVEVTTEGPVRTLLLNRPKARNAMSRAMVSELSEQVSHAEQEESVRVLVLRGAGGHFCAGGDIKDMAQARSASIEDGGADPIQELNAQFGHIAARFAAARIPVIAALEGAVMGGGFGLACAADVVVAAESTRFRLPETGLGVIPAQIAPFLIDRIGAAQTKRLALTGAKLDAQQAAAIGLVDVVAEDLDASIAEQAKAIMRGGPSANALTKALITELAQAARRQQVERAAELFAESARSPEAAEGVMAFMQKRKPNWTPSE